MRIRTFVAVGAAVVLPLATGASAATTSGATGTTGSAPHYREYVALGDSWTADVLTKLTPDTTYVPIDCGQSELDYPHQVAAILGVAKFKDASCGSATSNDFAQPQSGLPLGGTNPPQFDRLSPSTDLVTVGVGGNDIGLAGDVESCISLVPIAIHGGPEGVSPCKDRFTAGGVDQISNAIKAAYPTIVRNVGAIRTRSPHARIFMVNYLNGLPVTGRGCWPVQPVQDTDFAYLQAKFLEMNAMVAKVAKAVHATLVDTYTPTIGHDVCQAETIRYVEGLEPVSIDNPTLVNYPFHPNQAGADAQTRAVVETILAS